MSDQKDKITIIVNAQQKTISSSELSPDGEISFDQVVHLAYDPAPSGADIVYTMMFRHSPGRPLEGRLVAGQTVKIQEGTIFNVGFTDKS